MIITPGMPSMLRSPQSTIGLAVAGEVGQRRVAVNGQHRQRPLRIPRGKVPRKPRHRRMADGDDWAQISSSAITGFRGEHFNIALNFSFVASLFVVFCQ